VITAITVQDSQRVHAVNPVDADWLEDQARQVLEDMTVAAFKVGLIGSVENVAAIAEVVSDYPDIPLVLASAFRFDDAETAAGAFQGANEAWIYSRWGSPTVNHLEARLATVEGAESVAVTASGMAAIAGTILGLFSAGDHLIAPVAMYAESARLLRERLPRHGITTTFVPAQDLDAWKNALTPQTRAVYIETPANPTLTVTDIAAVVAFARAHGLLVLADNTFATPFCQNPLALGVDVVMHSATKAISGHGDVVGGVVAGSRAMVGAGCRAPGSVRV
jgi:cystathionine beta-lyase/cystathionine gamma-synthase